MFKKNRVQLKLKKGSCNISKAFIVNAKLHKPDHDHLICWLCSHIVDSRQFQYNHLFDYAHEQTNGIVY